MKQILWKEFGKQLLMSIGIFFALFLVLYMVEWLIPSLHGTLLQWHDPAFIVGIPASIIGVAYVLTIRNPQNYTGFYGGIAMALLLATQFYLQGNLDLVFLQLAVFIPFMVVSLLCWRNQVFSFVACPKFGLLLPVMSFFLSYFNPYILHSPSKILRFNKFRFNLWKQ